MTSRNMNGGWPYCTDTIMHRSHRWGNTFLQLQWTPRKLTRLLLCCVVVNSLWPSDVIWRQGSRWTLAQVMACCLAAPSHYLNQCWLSSVKSSGINLRAISHKMPQPPITQISFKNYLSKISIKSPRDQWVKGWLTFLLDYFTGSGQ